jgi:hypothetical protein
LAERGINASNLTFFLKKKKKKEKKNREWPSQPVKTGEKNVICASFPIWKKCYWSDW